MPIYFDDGGQLTITSARIECDFKNLAQRPDLVVEK